MSLNRLKDEELEKVVEIFRDLSQYNNIEKENYDEMVKQKKIYVPFIPDETCSKALFQSNTDRKINYLVGRRGTGKTTILKNVRTECFESFFIKKDLEHLKQEKMVLPVYIELRNLFLAVLDKISLKGDVIEDLKDLINNLNIQLLRQVEKSYDYLRELGVIHDATFLKIQDLTNKQINILVTSDFPILNEDSENLKTLYQTLKKNIEVISNNEYAEELLVELEGNNRISTFFKNWFKTDLFKALFEDLKLVKDYPLNYIYFLLDDFSEISTINQRIMIESFVEPIFKNLHASCFCIACYPGLYYSSSWKRNQEYQIVNLDFNQIDSDKSYEEKIKKGVELSTQLIFKRLNYEFPDLFRDEKSLGILFNDLPNFFNHLFFLSMRIPKLIGLILSHPKCITLLKMKSSLSIDLICKASVDIYTDYIYKDYFSSLFNKSTITSYFSKEEVKRDKIFLDNITHMFKKLHSKNSNGFFIIDKNLNSIASKILSRLEFLGFIFRLNNISENVILYCFYYGYCLKHELTFHKDEKIDYWITNAEENNISDDFNSILSKIDTDDNKIFNSKDIPQRFVRQSSIFEEIITQLTEQQLKILHTLYLQKDQNKGWMTPEEIGTKKRNFPYYIPHMRIMRIIRDIRNSGKARFLVDETEKGKILFRLSNLGILFEEYINWKLNT
jgi:hypothetical protein